MAFTVLAYLLFVLARELVSGPALPLGWRLACAVVLALLVLAIPYTRTTLQFGCVGFAYTLMLQLGLALNVVGVNAPLLWALPAAVLIPVCAGPLWLTPTHFFVGTALFCAAGLPLVLGIEPTRDVRVVGWMWLMISLPTAAVFHFGFYWFRRNHFRLEDRLARLAATDPLTGLRNRRAFMEQADERLAGIGHDGARGALPMSAIFVDIDHFKSLNDRFGHAAGDQTLQDVARALTKHAGPQDSVSRIGGEEFALLRETDLQGAVDFAEELRAAIGTIPRPDGMLAASFGVAEHRRGDSIMTLLDRADTALLRAKHSGRNRVCAEREIVAGPRVPVASPAGAQHADITQPLRQQWAEYWLTSHFQPLYSLSHQKQVGFEALLRGELADGTRVPPAILFAQKTFSNEGALDRASHGLHLGNARRLVPDDAWVFVNILPASFIAHDYADELARVAQEAGIAPQRIVLELLESHGGSVDEMSRAAQQFREHGFLIAVDDFGAGHSNLDRLFRIRPDLVKLDGELIRATSPGARKPVLPKLVSLLHHAGMLVVVEGVETNEELVLAVESNVDFAQGYLLGRPEATVPSPKEAEARIDHAFDAIAQGRMRQHATFEAQVQSYRKALIAAANGLANQALPGEAFATLCALPHCISCFILDPTGRQIGPDIAGAAATLAGTSLHPVADPAEARWDHRPYFRNAVLRPGVPVTSAPYLSLASGRPCVAVTMAIELAGARRVIGTELDWSKPDLPWPAGE
nr:bifunctional diguanylate cyclase/phosphodiesterase [Paraburkholderia phosphatilytica]